MFSDFNPDIIHIHGTERFYGLLGSRNLVSLPVVISFQGILHEIVKYHNYFGTMSPKDIITMHDPIHLLRGIGPLFSYIQLRRSAIREVEIIKQCNAFIGRTYWDHAHLAAINPEAHYF